MKTRELSFLIELLTMAIVFIFVIMILSRIYAHSLSKAQEAGRLNDAVILASNAAEVFLASDDPEEIRDTLNEENNAVLNGNDVLSAYDEELKADPNGKMKVEIHSDPKDDFVYGTIRVYYEEELLYELQTGYLKKEARP